MSEIYEEIRKFAEREKKEVENALQEEKKQVCIKADSYIAKEIKYQTALLFIKLYVCPLVRMVSFDII